MDIIGIKNPGLLTVKDEDGNLATGGDQHWYPNEGFIPPGACGATAASNVLAYLLRSRPPLFAIAGKNGLDGLSAPGENGAANAKTGYIGFMKKVYRFLFPRIGGLMTDHFIEGIGGLAEEYMLPVSAECLRVPIAWSVRPSFAETAAFIRSSLAADAPLAFLILSGGGVAKLDTWHWVTVLALDEDAKSVQILDNTETFWADIGVWLGTSIMGGAFVRLKEAGSPALPGQ